MFMFGRLHGVDLLINELHDSLCGRSRVAGRVWIGSISDKSGLLLVRVALLRDVGRFTTVHFAV